MEKKGNNIECHAQFPVMSLGGCFSWTSMSHHHYNIFTKDALNTTHQQLK